MGGVFEPGNPSYLIGPVLSLKTHYVTCVMVTLYNRSFRHYQLSGPVRPKYIGRLYFDLDWSNRHVGRTFAVSGQWLLSVYEVLVAHLNGPV